MLRKIDSIHDLEAELIKIDSQNPNPQQRIKSILTEMKNLSQKMTNLTVLNEIFEEKHQVNGNHFEYHYTAFYYLLDHFTY